MRIWLAAAVLILSGCALPRAPGREYTVGGQDLGSSSGRKITVAESQVSFSGENDPVRSREANSLRDRYVENLVLSNGAILGYEKLYNSGFTSRDTPADLVKYEVDKPRYRDRGIVFDRTGVKRAGQFFYFVQESTTSTCFVFRAFFGDTSKGRPDNIGDQGSYGNVCYSSSERSAAALEAEMLALLGRVRFDEGAINRARNIGTVIPATATMAPSPLSASPVSPAPPSAATTTMAGRLRELRGLFDQGLISQSEFDQKRQSILNSL
jgi:hypothetical protein